MVNSQNRASWASTTSHWRWGISMRHWRSTAVSSDLNWAAKVTPWPSSIWANSLSPFRRAAGSPHGRHFGLVVDDKEAARKALEAVGVTLLDGPFLDFRDPWGNRVEIVGYDNIQFTKAPNVLRGMGLMHLGKNEKAKRELAEKGMALD
jgi:hypothetical protein